MKKILFILVVIILLSGCANLGGRSESGVDNPFVSYTSDPCGNLTEATMFYNSTNDIFCFCNGAGDDLSVEATTTPCF